MKVFISWSGEKSKAVAELFKVWLKSVLQSVKPWVSTDGIERGQQWLSAINEEISTVNMGIICLTGENKNSPWILYECGSLAKGLSNSRIFTFLIDLRHNDIEMPLAQFNHTLPTKEDIYALISTINKYLVDPLEKNILDVSFEALWAPFEKSFSTFYNLR